MFSRLSAPYPGHRDAMEAVAELAERLPEALQPLAALAFNYRWTWMVRRRRACSATSIPTRGGAAAAIRAR